MIEINLLPGPKRKKAAGAGFQLPNFGELLTKVKNPLLLSAVGAWAVVLVLIGVVYTAESARLASREEELRRVEAESRRFAALIAQKRREEKLRDSLVAELQAIRSIDADRYIWPHILDEITKALPDFTWLEGLTAQGVAAPDPADSAAPQIRFLIDGRTGDMGGYTRFLRQLGSSPWIGNVVAGPTRTVVENEKPVLSFTITATFRRADSAFIRTVPVLESVR